MRRFMRNLPLAIMTAACIGPAVAGIRVQASETPAPGSAWRDFSADGAWCWFGDPRAVRHDGRTYAGWVTGRGDIEVGMLDPESGLVRRFMLHERFQRDDHDVPSLLFLPDGRLMAFYSGHGGPEMNARVCERPRDLSGWGPVRALGIHPEPRTGRSVTYPNPVLLSREDNAIYLFWRGGDAKPNWARSRDGGETWENLGTIVRRSDAEPGNRPYVKIAANGEDRIHMVFTSGHPRNEPHNSVFYCLYRDGAFHKTDGTRIAGIEELPFEPAQADLVYDASATGARAWVWDIASDAAGHPVIVYTRHPSEKDHRYHYARWNGSAWEDAEICAAGRWFPETEFGRREPEPHYSGGLVLDHADPSIVYLSRPVDGVFEIERWSTADGGRTWTSAPVTRESERDNVRPFVVRDHGGLAPRVLWMHNRSYVHYSRFDCAVKMDMPADPPPVARARRFDFQPLDSPAAPDRAPVGATTAYAAGLGYGWVSLPETERDRGAGDPLDRDLVADSIPRTFRVRLPDGPYEVRVRLGDPEFAHDWMEIVAEGRLAASGIHTAAGEIREIAIPVTVTGGELDLTFRDGGGDDANWALTGLGIVEGASDASRPPSAPLPAPVPAEIVVPDPAAVLELLHRVADWQIPQPPRHRTDDWTYGAFYAGIMALADVSPDAGKYHDAMIAMGTQHAWQPGPRVYHADDHCVCQTYLELYLRRLDPGMIRPTQERFDAILAAPKGTDLTWGTPAVTDKWSWCDALFMGPPAWLRLYVVTGDRRYLDFMNDGWWNTSGHLYDAEERLYYRDGSFFERREPNGRKVFWSRGNGWVFAGLARVLQFLPQDHPDRARYIGQFREMAARVAAIQPPDGLWRPSLLDPDSTPVQETSGTGFFCYGLAWGIRHGILDRQEFEPALLRAWNGLTACVQPNGKLTHVQPPAGGPQLFDPRSSEVYGVGAFLLAGSEVFRLAGGTPPPRAHVRYVPERLDDVAWENDRIAYRVYGPALGPSGTVDSGIDVWVKSVRYPVIDAWYAAGDYHNDHGEGLDYYSVGTARGCGASAVWSGGRMHTPGVWTAHRIIENGPGRARFELDHRPVEVGGRRIAQTRRIALPMGAHLNEIEDVFTCDSGAPLVIALGIAKRAGEGRAVMDKAAGILSYWEPEHPVHGSTACAVVADPRRVRDMIETEDHYLVLVDAKPGEPLRYFAGAGWSGSGDFPDPAAWESYVRDAATRAAWPDEAGRASPRFPGPRPAATE